MTEIRPVYASTVTLLCDQCGGKVQATVPALPPFYVEVTCPHCNARLIYERARQRQPGPTERKPDGAVIFRAPEGRFLGEFDPATQTVMLPYKGRDLTFSVK